MSNEFEILVRNIYLAESNFHRTVIVDDTFLDYVVKIKATYTELLVRLYPYCQHSKLKMRDWERYKQSYDTFSERVEVVWNMYSNRDSTRAIQPRFRFDGQNIKKHYYLPNKNVALYQEELNDAIEFIHTGDPNSETDIDTIKKQSAYHHYGYLYLSTAEAENKLGKKIAPGRWKVLKRLSSEYEQLSNVFLSQAIEVSPAKAIDPILSKYIGFFKSLNRSNRGGESAPHKLILLMAVIKLYDNPKQQNKTVIQMSSTLNSYFDYFWDLHVKSSVWIKDISMPWKHMKSEPFWNECQNKDGCCWIEPELKGLLNDKESRTILNDVLKEQIPDSSHKVKPETQRNTDTQRSNKKWSKVDIKQLIEAFNRNATFAEIAKKLYRTESAVASKLQQLGYVVWDKETEQYIKK